MIWTQFKILWPSFAGYWVFMFALVAATYFMFTKIFPRTPFKWSLPVTSASAIVAVMIGNMCLSTYQGMAIYKYQQANAPQTSQSNNDGKTPVDPALQMKADFLKIVEQLSANPEQIKEDIRAKVFTQFGQLFPKSEDKEVYMKSILSVYECQRYFWEDALSSYQSKKEIKSDARAKCEKAPGSFFNREKLISAENVKDNAETISKFAAHKRLPAAEGKTVEVTEEMLRNALEKQISTIEAVKKLFASTPAQK